MAEHVDIVFDGPPGPEGNRFIEVENASGRSIAFGEWIERQDRRWVLRITAADFQKPRRTVDTAKVQGALDRWWSVSDGKDREMVACDRFRVTPLHPPLLSDPRQQAASG